MEYKVLAKEVIFEEEIKKSRFITYLRRVQSLSEFKDFLAEIKELHPKARHHCWGVIAGAPQDNQQWGFSDDGEPTGTAGKPIFNHLQGSHAGEIAAIVVRYFGGVLLGTGGLVKAYGSGVRGALLEAEYLTVRQRDKYQVSCAYDQINLVNKILQTATYDVIILNQDFGMEVRTKFAMPSEYLAEVNKILNERSAGTLMVEELE